MALINFPSSPTPNQLWPASPGPGETQYIWSAARSTWLVNNLPLNGVIDAGQITTGQINVDRLPPGFGIAEEWAEVIGGVIDVTAGNTFYLLVDGNVTISFLNFNPLLNYRISIFVDYVSGTVDWGENIYLEEVPDLISESILHLSLDWNPAWSKWLTTVVKNTPRQLSFLAVAHQTSPYLTVYKARGDNLLKLSTPLGSLSSTALSCSFSPDGKQLAVASYLNSLDGTRYVTIFNREGDSFLRTPTDPFNVTPPSNTKSCKFSPNGDYLAITENGSPYIHIYKKTGDTFTLLANPTGGLPTGTAESCAFSPDSNYLVVVHSNSPYVTIYKRTGDAFAKLADPTGTALPDTTVYGCAFSPDGSYLAIGFVASPFVAVYKRTGDSFARLSDPTGIAGSSVFSCDFSPDGNYLATGTSVSPYIVIYKRTGDAFVKLADPIGGLPAGTGYACKFSKTGEYLSTAHTGGSFISTYKRDGDTFTKLEDPVGGLPTGIGRDLDYYITEVI